MTSQMGARPRQTWIWMAVLVGAGYGLIGILFALPASHVRAWRLGAWIVSGMVYLIHIGYERLRRGHSPLISALHVASAAGLGGFSLALAAFVHSRSIETSSQHQRLLLIALVAWPIITGVPALLLGFGASSVLVKRSRICLARELGEGG